VTPDQVVIAKAAPASKKATSAAADVPAPAAPAASAPTAPAAPAAPAAPMTPAAPAATAPLPPTPAAAAPEAPPAAAAAPESSGMTCKKDPAFAKYFKMMDVGIPMPAVAMKMDAEGLDSSILSCVPNLPAHVPVRPPAHTHARTTPACTFTHRTHARAHLHVRMCPLSLPPRAHIRCHCRHAHVSAVVAASQH